MPVPVKVGLDRDADAEDMNEPNSSQYDLANPSNRRDTWPPQQGRRQPS